MRSRVGSEAAGPDAHGLPEVQVTFLEPPSKGRRTGSEAEDENEEVSGGEEGTGEIAAPSLLARGQRRRSNGEKLGTA